MRSNIDNSDDVSQPTQTRQQAEIAFRTTATWKAHGRAVCDVIGFMGGALHINLPGGSLLKDLALLPLFVAPVLGRILISPDDEKTYSPFSWFKADGIVARIGLNLTADPAELEHQMRSDGVL